MPGINCNGSLWAANNENWISFGDLRRVAGDRQASERDQILRMQQPPLLFDKERENSTPTFHDSLYLFTFSFVKIPPRFLSARLHQLMNAADSSPIQTQTTCFNYTRKKNKHASRFINNTSFLPNAEFPQQRTQFHVFVWDGARKLIMLISQTILFCKKKIHFHKRNLK